MNNFSKILISLSILTAVFLFGRSCGRDSIDITERIVYIEGETIRDTISVPQYVEVEVEGPIRWLTRTVEHVVNDTLIIVEKVDTMAILADWALRRTYSENLFNNRDGILNIGAEVQYNRLQMLTYDFTPIHREITRYVERPRHNWSVGPSISYGINSKGQHGFFMGVGIQYTILRW